MRRVWIGGIGLLVLALALPMCTGVPLTAPSNSDITLYANPKFVSANGGVSVLTAIVTEPAGTPPPNGTVVFFFTNLGSVDAEAKTKDGVARVNFVSDSRSGTARVTAVSGGIAAPPGSPTSPSPSSSPTLTDFIPSLFEMTVAHADKNTAFVDITVGSLNATKVLAVAAPARITSPRSALITANIFDGVGNPVANVPVIFTVSPVGTVFPLEETLDSGGAPQFTDTNGQAFDTLRTRRPLGSLSKTVTVSATTANGIKGDIVVGID